MILLPLLQACAPAPVDADGDGWGTPADCDDDDRRTWPGARERCDGADHDCNGTVDDLDADRDGYPAAECGGPDCDDADPAVGPGISFLDDDGDGHAGTEVTGCDVPAGAAVVATDCDDTDPAIGPTAVERCDGRDQDCDGAIDELAIDRVVLYADADSDGFGDVAASVLLCPAEADGRVDDGSDCDDQDAAVHPETLEVCANGVDDDCDGLAPDCGVFGVGTADAVDVDFRFDGDDAEVGQIVPIGDVDGDGELDLIVAHASDILVLRGPFGDPTLDVDSAWSNHDFTNSARVGGAVDFDGDGQLDLVVAAPDDFALYGAGFGALWILFGPAWRDPGTVYMFDADELGGTFYPPDPASIRGIPALPGDVDEDGLDDLLVAGDLSGEPNGIAWLVRGGTLTTGESLSLELATPMVTTAPEDHLGDSVSAPGDLDGDGIGDLLIAAPTDDTYTLDGGVIHLVYGGRPSSPDRPWFRPPPSTSRRARRRWGGSAWRHRATPTATGSPTS